MIINDYDLNNNILNTYRVYILPKENIRSFEILRIIVKVINNNIYFFKNIKDFFHYKNFFTQDTIFILKLDNNINNDLTYIINFFLNYAKVSSRLIIIYKIFFIKHSEIDPVNNKYIFIHLNEFSLLTYKRWFKKYIKLNDHNISDNKLDYIGLFYFNEQENLLTTFKTHFFYFIKCRIEIKDIILMNENKNKFNKVVFNNLYLLYLYKKLKNNYNVNNLFLFKNKNILDYINIIKLDILLKNKQFNKFYIKLFKLIASKILKGKKK